MLSLLKLLQLLGITILLEIGGERDFGTVYGTCARTAAVTTGCSSSNSVRLEIFNCESLLDFIFKSFFSLWNETADH